MPEVGTEPVVGAAGVSNRDTFVTTWANTGNTHSLTLWQWTNFGVAAAGWVVGATGNGFSEMGWFRDLAGVAGLASALLLSGDVGLAADTAVDAAPIRSETVALDGATSARIEIALGVGRLRLAGGSLAGAGTPMPSGELLRGDFSFGVEDLKPEIAYTVEGSEGRLQLEQQTGDGSAWPWNDQESAWDLYLNPTVPTDLSVEIGAGDSELALGGLTLTGLDVATGAGETTLDFAGDWHTGLQAQIDGGAGDLTLRLPRDVGVRVAIEHGTGDLDVDGFAEESDGVYVNDAYGTAAVTLDLEVRHGAGDLDLGLVD